MNVKICFVLFMSLFILSRSYATVLDSVGVTQKEGKNYIIHQIKSGETLYALAKKYNVPFQEIKNANPGVGALSVGQKVLVPAATNASVSTKTSSSNESTKITHEVKSGESLFSISKKYGVTVSELKEWNQLKDTGLKLGQKITILSKKDLSNPEKNTTTASEVTKKEVITKKAEPAPIKETTKKETASSTESNPKKEVESIKPHTEPTSTHKEEKIEKAETPVRESKITHESTTKKEEQKSTPSSDLSNYGGFKKLTQEGSILLTNDEKYKGNFSYCLHATAPVGTIIKIIHDQTGKFVFARVMGSIPASESTILKVNQAVMDKMGVSGTQFKAKISYAL